MATNIVGRINEQAAFKSMLGANQSDFVAVYGRRRVGKTFLIRETFNNSFQFQLTGLANATMKQQLANFHASLTKFYGNKKQLPIAKNWFDAFQQLIAFLEKSKSTKKKVIFLDELPWLDTSKSNFITALEHFWNSWASARKDILLIVCGSAASWMLNKLINNKGGLHNRVTHKIKLEPFTLAESEAYLKVKNIKWNKHQIVENYMVMGGIPFYMSALKPGISAAQSINELCFTTNGLLNNEFSNLYASLFKNANNHISVVGALSKKAKGLTREEIIKTATLPNGGGVTKVLDELEASGFIRKYLPFEKNAKDALFQLIDFYTLFYFKFIKQLKGNDENYWLSIQDTPTHRVWAGYAFEQVCLAHLPQIKKALGISGIQTKVASWRTKQVTDGAQIDLLIERKDQIINLCEIKFSINEFTIDKKYATNLRNKIGVFKQETKTKHAVHLCMITSNGVKKNEYATELIQNNIMLDSLFKNV